VTVWIVPCFSVKLRATVRGMLTALREPSMVAFAKVQMMIYVPIEVFGSVEPGSRSYEYAP
jgi:hypothetical protein